VSVKSVQPSLFADPALPEGFRYQPDFLSPDEETALIARFADLPFKPFEFQQYQGLREVVYFGHRYDYQKGVLQVADDQPAWLAPVRARAAAFAGLEPERLAQAMVTRYDPGAPIGWHRDRPQFADVIGISLASACTFRFRRKRGDGWERASLIAEPRSIYLLRGPAREEWQHSIPPAPERRFSITFRTFR
jgi:alkylated DNA repair dioxygenase AlkB